MSHGIVTFVSETGDLPKDLLKVLEASKGMKLQAVLSSQEEADDYTLSLSNILDTLTNQENE